MYERNGPGSFIQAREDKEDDRRERNHRHARAGHCQGVPQGEKIRKRGANSEPLKNKERSNESDGAVKNHRIKSNERAVTNQEGENGTDGSPKNIEWRDAGKHIGPRRR